VGNELIDCGVEAPRWQDAATKEYSWYFEELQRSQRGWIGVTIILLIFHRILSITGGGP